MRFTATEHTLPRFGSAQIFVAPALAGLLFLAVLKFGMTALIAGVVVVALLLVAIAQPDTATLVVLFVIYSDAAAVAVRSHGVPSVFAMGFVLLLFIPIVSYIIFGKQPIRVNAVFALMVAYIGTLLASALMSRYTSDTFDPINKYILEGLVLYFLVINSIRTPAVVRKALWMILLAGTLLAATTIVQELTRSYDNEYAGFALTKIVNAQGRLDEANTETGEKDSKGRAVVRPRATGPIGDPNFYGQILCVLLPISVIFFFSHPQRFLRIFAGASFLLLVGAVLLTFSRGASIAVAVLVIALALLRYLKIRHIMAVAAVVVIATLINPAYRSRLDTFSIVQSHGMREADYSVKERATILLASVRIFLDHPLFGVGPGQSSKYIAAYGNAQGYAKVRRGMEAHNTYLQQLDETGIVGFLFLGSIVFVTIRNLYRVRVRWRNDRPEYSHVATALILAIGMFLTTSIFLHLAYLRYLSLLLALGGSAVLVYEAEEVSTLPRDAHGAGARVSVKNVSDLCASTYPTPPFEGAFVENKWVTGDIPLETKDLHDMFDSK